MRRPLDFVDHGHGIVLCRDAALAIRIIQHLIRTEPEIPSALAGGEVG